MKKLNVARRIYFVGPMIQENQIFLELSLFFNTQTDFQTKLRFSEEYNKVSLAKATRSSHVKQQIIIRVYFNVPGSYKTLINEDNVFLERVFDKKGKMTERFSNDSKRAQINRLVNRIQYIYIPALKGENVLQYILGLIGEYELIEHGDIETLNNKINKKTEDLSRILKESKIQIGTSFGLPVLLTDFWQKLSVDTQFDKFQFIDSNIKGKSGLEKKLNPAFFKIPLNARGEGIKSKYIPPLLQWLKRNDTRRIYVWGIDEPENSLEFGLATDLSELYYNHYAAETQMFLTSHSLAFINPSKGMKTKPKIFRCIKNEDGTTEVKALDDLFKEQHKYDLYLDIGVLEIQREVMENYRKIRSEWENSKVELDKLKQELKQRDIPIILTEGKSDAKILEIAWEKLNEREPMPFSVIPSGVEINKNQRTGGACLLKRTLELTSVLKQNTTIIGLFDNDKEGNEQFCGLDKKIFEEHSLEKKIRKHKNENIWGMLMPVPSERVIFVTKSSLTERYFELEHYFPNEILDRYNLKGPNILNTEVFKIKKESKVKFAEAIVSKLNKDSFKNFDLLFNEIRKIIGY
jgi:hypothetical protein